MVGRYSFLETPEDLVVSLKDNSPFHKIVLQIVFASSTAFLFTINEAIVLGQFFTLLSFNVPYQFTINLIYTLSFFGLCPFGWQHYSAVTPCF